MSKFDPLLRKKLFLLVTRASAGLTIDDHDFRHSTLYLRVRISPDINMSRYNSELFPALRRPPATTSAFDSHALLLGRLLRAPFFQYPGSSVNLKLIVNGVRPKNHHAELNAS
jgi:hypothetical protein